MITPLKDVLLCEKHESKRRALLEALFFFCRDAGIMENEAIFRNDDEKKRWRVKLTIEEVQYDGQQKVP